MCQPRGLAGLLLLASLFWASEAAAGGFWYLDRGVSNYARGGANIAAPDDPIAVYTNPAALAGHRGLKLMVDGNMVVDNRRFERAPDDLDGDGDLAEYPAVQNDWPAFPPSPGFFASYNFASLDLERLSVGVGAYGPPRADSRYPAEGPQRFNLVESHHLQIHYGAAVAYELPWFGARVGLTALFTSQVVDATMRLNVGELLFANPEDPDYDVAVHLTGRQDFIPTPVLGVSATPLPWITFAASYQFAYDVTAPGKAEVTLGDGVSDVATVSGDDVDVSVSFAPLLRLATRLHDPEQVWDLEMAFVWEGWSRNERVLLQPKGIIFESPLFAEPLELPEIRLENGFRDTFSVRLGGSYVVVPELLRARLGGYYERGAVPERRLAVSAFDLDKLGLAGGVRVELPLGLWVDMTGGYVHWLAREVKDSDIRFATPVETDPGQPADPGWPITRGRYSNQQVIIMGALGVQLDI